jgi:hypothetical protein
MSRDAKQLCSCISFTSKRCEPFASSNIKEFNSFYLLQIVGATATVSTFATVVGQPKRPTSAGNGGLRRGFPCFPSKLSIKEVSSPQI